MSSESPNDIEQSRREAAAERKRQSRKRRKDQRDVDEESLVSQRAPEASRMAILRRSETPEATAARLADQRFIDQRRRLEETPEDRAERLDNQANRTAERRNRARQGPDGQARPVGAAMPDDMPRDPYLREQI